MSNSDSSTHEEVDQAVDALIAAAGHAAAGEALALDDRQAASLLRLAAECFARLEDPYRREVIAHLDLSPTAACTAAAALLHSQSLTPFEFNIWFSQARVGSGDESAE